MSLGAVAYKVGGTRQCSSTKKEVSMATLLAAPTRHRHTELFSGILTIEPIHTWPWTEGRRVGKKTQHKKWQARNKAIAKTLCDELQASNCIYKSWGAPSKGIRPAPTLLGKLLTSIALITFHPMKEIITFR